jgi:glycosyltransferase involved in cell wall biosynthesis
VPLAKNCRFIVTTHDVIFNEYPGEFSTIYRIGKNFLYSFSAKRADILTTVSDYSRKSIQKYLGIRNKQIHVIANGVHNKFFEPYDKNASRKYILEKYGFNKFILFVSRIEPRKNHVFLLKAFLELQLYKQGYHLVLLGHETLPVPEFDTFISNLPKEISKFIYINGDIGDDDLLEFYRAAALFVYPSKAEGFGIPPLEAAALKTPVLCSNSSAMSDFTFFGADLIDPLDTERFKNKLQSAIDTPHDPGYLEHLSGIVKEKYSWEHSAQKLQEALLIDKKTNFAKF